MTINRSLTLPARVAIALALTYATILVYSPIFTHQFVYEDAHWLKALHTEYTTYELLTRSGLYWSYALNAFVAGESPASFHVVNLILHMVNGALVGWLVWRIFQPATFDRQYMVWRAKRDHAERLAWLATGIFLLHPLNSEAVNYVAARGDLLVTMGVLIACVAVPVTSACGWCTLAIGFVLALSAKEIGIAVVPLVVLVAWWTWRPPTWREWTWMAACWGIFLLLGLSKVIAINGEMSSLGQTWGWWWTHQALRIDTFAGLVVWPVPWRFTVDHGWADPIAWAALVVGGLTWWMLVHEETRHLVVFAWGWAVISLALRFIVRDRELMAERHVYLAMVGGSAWLGAMVESLYMYCVRTPRPFEDEEIML